MIFPSDDDWRNWGITNEVHKFFLLRLEDIFAENTYDSWQVRTSNIRTILTGIIESCDVVKKVHHYHHNLKVLLEEAHKIAKNDHILKYSFPFTETYLTKLSGLYENQVKNTEKVNIEPFANLAKVILGNLSQYRESLQKRIKDHLEKPLETKFKIEIYDLALSLGTELLSMGYSTNHCQDCIEKLKDASIPFFHDRFEALMTLFDGTEKPFQCNFYVTWPTDIGKFPTLNDRIVLNLQNQFGKLTPEEDKFYKQDREAVIASICVAALDPYSARYKAEEELGGLFAVTGLYKLSKTTAIRHKYALVRSENSHKCITKDKSWQGYVKDSTKASDNVAGIYTLLSTIDDSEARQLLASLQYHRLALSATTDESMLVNLWIALESIIQDGGKNIIDRISSYVSASVTTSYTHQTLKAFTISIIGFWRGAKKESFLHALPSSTERYLHPEDLARIFLDENNSATIKGFLSTLNGHQLLLFRASSLYDNLFGCPKSLKNRLEKHKNNVAWQLRRIYRIRNLIMHTGHCPVGTRQLIQNLHTYYIVTMHNIINDLKRHPNWGVYEALDHRNYVYELLHDRLTRYSEQPISARTLVDPCLVLTDNGSESAWHPSRL